jgi:hypothetical protein
MSTVEPTTKTARTLVTGATWRISVKVTDDDGGPVAAFVAGTVTDPDGVGTVPTVIDGDPAVASTGTAGFYYALVPVPAPGRWVATLAVSGVGVVPFMATVADVISAQGMPTIDDATEYLGVCSATDVMIQDALDAEAAAQAAKCKTGPTYGADLRQALLRRVARNLALRGIPLAVLQGDSESGSTVLPSADPEVRRLEAPHRKRKVG